MKKTTAQIVKAVAIAMREAYGEHLNDPVIPWDEADRDKKNAWLAIAEAGIATYETLAGKDHTN